MFPEHIIVNANLIRAELQHVYYSVDSIISV